MREKEYLRKDASRVPVLVARALFEWKPEEGVSFVIDMTDRKRAKERLRASEQRFLDAQMELAHVTRTTTLGELAGSIAHEVNQLRSLNLFMDARREASTESACVPTTRSDQDANVNEEPRS